jgi:leucyl/phenylalanyl-tRNA--protein transferase
MDIRNVTQTLTAAMTEEAYRNGLFPMGNPEDGFVTWHRPNRRAVLPLDGFHVSRSLQHTLKKAAFEVSFNRDFEGVMRACARTGEDSWITEEFIQVYGELQKAGKAHSVEIWVDGLLAGGVYGVHLGAGFFAESKFHRVRDMSKVALAHLVFRLRERGFKLLEVQYLTPHLERFGVVEVSNRDYLTMLAEALRDDCRFP